MGSDMSCMKKEIRDNKVSIETDSNIYHEKQIKELCALHALNNLFQDGEAFSKQDLDDICLKLSPDNMINPHRSMLGLGNYDVNVIMAALQTKQYDTVWFDKRKDIDILQLQNIKGFILNIPTEYKWGIFLFPMRRKHWITIRQIGNVYYNLDSKLDAPEIIGKQEELKTYLKEQIDSKEKELLLIVTQEVEKVRSWEKDNLAETENVKTKSTKSENDNIDDVPQFNGKSCKAGSDINSNPENVGKKYREIQGEEDEEVEKKEDKEEEKEIVVEVTDGEGNEEKKEEKKKTKCIENGAVITDSSHVSLEEVKGHPIRVAPKH